MTMLLQIDDLHVEFPTQRGTVHAVNGVSLTVDSGEILGIVGESGSGKSMTARAILRLVPAPGRIVSGSVWLNGENVLAMNRRELGRMRGRQTSMVFQEPGAALNPVMSVGDQLTETLRAHNKLSRSKAKARAIEHLREVGIPAPDVRYRSYPHQLSGGMQQRCMIAMALASEPDLLIADEPTTALDVTIQAQILELLVELTRQREMGLILISHNIGAVAQIAGRIAVMYAGRIVEIGGTAQVIDTPQHPYTVALLEAMPSVKVKRGQELLEIAGQVPDLANIPAGCPFHPRCPKVFDQCDMAEPVLTQTEPEREVSCWLYTKEATI